MKRKGFTLTEMIAAIVILAIIIGLATAVYHGIKVRVLASQYNNLVTYLETKAANYAEDTGELNVTVEKLIITGYVEADKANKIVDPRDNSSMNCVLFDSVYTNGSYNAKISNDIGESESGVCNEYQINKEIQICVYEGDECKNEIKEWYNDNVTLGVKVGGSQAEPDKKSINWKSSTADKGTEEKITTKVEGSSSVIYTVEVRYEYNKDDGTVKVFSGSDTVSINIDRERPTVDKVEVVKANEWSSGKKEVKVYFSDGFGSGVEKISVYKVTDPSQECPSLDDVSWIDATSSPMIFELGEGSYKVCVIDRAGNISDPDRDKDDDDDDVIVIDKIDNIPPTCNIEITEGKVGEPGWYISYPRIVMTSSDNEEGSGVSSYGLSEKEGYYNNKNVLVPSKDVVNANYYGVVRDGAGNVGKCIKDKVNIDTKKPTVDSLKPSTTSWTNADIKLTTKAVDDTSKPWKYGVTTSNNEPDKWTNCTVNNNECNITYSASGNGTYYLWVMDGAGNINNSRTIKLSNIDKEPPTISNPTYSPTGWTNGNVKISATISDSASKLVGYAVTTSDKAPSTFTKLNNVASYNVTYTAESNNTYYIWAKDAAGNVISKSIKITNIDKDKPTVNNPTYSPKGWTNGNVKISTTISDSASKLVGYAVTTSDKTPTTFTKLNNVASYNVTYTAESNNTYYIWAKDAAGNVASKSIKITNIDKTIPTISNLKLNPTGWTNGNVKIEAKLGDKQSKLAGYAVTTSDKTPSSWTTKDVKDKDSYSLSYSVSSNGTYYVHVKDNAGNTIKKSITVDKIDKTAPTVSVTYNGYKNDTCATIKETCTTTNTCLQFNHSSCTKEGEYITDNSYSDYYYGTPKTGTSTYTGTTVNPKTGKPYNTGTTTNPKTGTSNDTGTTVNPKTGKPYNTGTTIPKNGQNSNDNVSGPEINVANQVCYNEVSAQAWRDYYNNYNSGSSTNEAFISDNSTSCLKTSSGCSDNSWFNAYDNVTCTCVDSSSENKCKQECISGQVIDWQKSPTISITIKDNESGIKGFAVSKTKSNPTKWETKVNNTTLSGTTKTFEYAITANGTYYVYAIDNAGNISKTPAEVKVINADSTAPVIKSFTMEDAEGNTYNSNKIKLTVVVTKDNGSPIEKYCFTKANTSSGCTWHQSSEYTYSEIIEEGTIGSGEVIKYNVFVQDKAKNEATKDGQYTLYKTCDNKIKECEKTGSCSTSCGTGKQTTTTYWKDAVLGTACKSTTSDKSCTASYGCCTSCYCYNNCPPPDPDPDPEDDCDWKCKADYNSNAWHDCEGRTDCSYYDGNGELTTGGRDDMKEANDQLYGENYGPPGTTYNPTTGERTDNDTGECQNCRN